MTTLPRWEDLESFEQTLILDWTYAESRTNALSLLCDLEGDTSIECVREEVEAFAQSKLEARFAPYELPMRVARELAGREQRERIEALHAFGYVLNAVGREVACLSRAVVPGPGAGEYHKSLSEWNEAMSKATEAMSLAVLGQSLSRLPEGPTTYATRESMDRWSVSLSHSTADPIADIVSCMVEMNAAERSSALPIARLSSAPDLASAARTLAKGETSAWFNCGCGAKHSLARDGTPVTCCGTVARLAPNGNVELTQAKVGRYGFTPDATPRCGCGAELKGVGLVTCACGVIHHVTVNGAVLAIGVRR